MWHFPHTTEKSFKDKYERIEWRNDMDDFKSWCDGKTGYPIVDAGMRELYSTGWMHNRVRMILGSFLVKHLLINWKEGEKYFPLIRVSKINGLNPNIVRDRVSFEHLTPLFPEQKFNLAEKGSSLSTRIIDLFSPIGKGQRGMIVAQPKTGKTMLLKDIANAIAANHPEVYQ